MGDMKSIKRDPLKAYSVNMRRCINLINDEMFDQLYKYEHADDFQIHDECKRMMAYMPQEQKDLLQWYLCQGEQRTQKVVQRVTLLTLKPRKRVEEAISNLMNIEPYVVFYKTHILNTQTDFASIGYWTKIAIKKIRYRPTYLERLIHTEGFGRDD